MTKRIIVLRSGALGDVVLTLPAIHVLRCDYPDASIEALGRPEIWRVAGSMVDAVARIEAPMFAGLFSGTLSPELRSWLEGVDLAVAWMVQDPRSVLEMAGVPHVVYASPYPPPGMHSTAWLLGTLPAERERGQTWRLALTEKERGWAHDALACLGVTRPIIVHPGAGSQRKRWPADRFAALGMALMQQGYQVVLMEGPADAEVVATIQEHAVSPFPVLRDLDARRLAAALAGARCLIGNDSGVTHLAGAVGAPTLALFGPTDPASWAPLGNARVLRRCHTRAVRQGQLIVCDDPSCMEAISIGEVLSNLAALGC